MKQETHELIGRIGARVGEALLVFSALFFLYLMAADSIRFNAKWGTGGEIDQIIQANKEAERQRAFEASLDNFARKNNNNTTR